MKIKAIGALALAGIAIGAQAAPAQDYDTPKPITIKMVLKGKRVFFKGPGSVTRGSTITFQNTTKPKDIGPHTVSVVKPALVPTSKAARKDCGKNLAAVCGDIAKAHKVNPKTFAIGAPDVDAGKPGWNTAFGKSGDTWYTEKKGDTETRKATGKVGSTLTFLCVVHPKMVKKVKIV